VVRSSFKTWNWSSQAIDSKDSKAGFASIARYLFVAKKLLRRCEDYSCARIL